MKIDLICLLVLCAIMAIPMFGNWGVFNGGTNTSYDQILKLFRIEFRLINGTFAVSSYPDEYTREFFPTINIIRGCVIIGYIFLLLSLFFYPHFALPLLLAGICATAAGVLWLINSRAKKFRDDFDYYHDDYSLYIELIGGILMLIFGIKINFF